MQPTPTPISMRINAVWLVFVVRMQKPCTLAYPNAVSKDLQANLNLRCGNMHEGTFSDNAAQIRADAIVQLQKSVRIKISNSFDIMLLCQYLILFRYLLNVLSLLV